MDNRGKLWTIDDDQKLMEQPELSNAYFAASMGRTENAIKYRRCHLAVRMYQNDQAAGAGDLLEYVKLMNADYDQAAAILDESIQKHSTLRTCIERNRKRKLVPPPTAAHHSSTSSAPDMGVDPIVHLCKRICDEGGNLTPLWTSQEDLPLLIRHYQGFEAYARVVSVLSSSGHQ